jgi:hypothetical protein
VTIAIDEEVVGFHLGRSILTPPRAYGLSKRLERNRPRLLSPHSRFALTGKRDACAPVVALQSRIALDEA